MTEKEFIDWLAVNGMFWKKYCFYKTDEIDNKTIYVEKNEQVFLSAKGHIVFNWNPLKSKKQCTEMVSLFFGNYFLAPEFFDNLKIIYLKFKEDNQQESEMESVCRVLYFLKENKLLVLTKEE